MKLFPLRVRKEIARRMNWFGDLSATFLIIGAFVAGIAGLFRTEYKGAGGPGEKQENTVLQQKVTHLVQSYTLMKAEDTVIAVSDKGTDMGLDSMRAHARQKSLKAAFDAEAQATGIALADARLLSPDERFRLYKQLDVISPHPDYLRSAEKGDNDAFILFNHAQSKVMDRPGFTPSVAAARQIVDYNGLPNLFVLGFFFGAPLLAAAGAFGFSKARDRLNISVEKEERAIRDKERDDLLKAKAKEREDAKRLAEEQERLAKLPPSTALDRDIQVRQIKLAPKS